jgi:hypothetical protein
MLVVFGVVVTGATILGWGKGWIPLAIGGAFFSAFIMLSIFLTVLDNQEKITSLENAEVTKQIGAKSALDQQIEKALASVDASTLKRDDPLNTVNQWQRLNSAVQDANRTLSTLRAQKDVETKEMQQKAPDKAQSVTLHLTAWSIFHQIPEFKWSDAPHVVAFLALVFLSVLVQTIIGFTVPRVSTIPIAVSGKPIEVRHPRKWGKKEFDKWLKWNNGPRLLTADELDKAVDLKRIRWPRRWVMEMTAKAVESGLVKRDGTIVKKDKE